MSDFNNKVIYCVLHSMVTFYFKDGTTYLINSDRQPGRYMYCYGVLPDDKFEVYENDVWECLKHKARYADPSYDGERTLFKKRTYLPSTSIFGIYTNRRIYKDELTKFTYTRIYKDCSDNLPSIQILENDLGFKDYSEFVFNREHELKRMLLRD